jgi:hypothetical protein
MDVASTRSVATPLCHIPYSPVLRLTRPALAPSLAAAALPLLICADSASLSISFVYFCGSTKHVGSAMSVCMTPHVQGGWTNIMALHGVSAR